MWKVNMKTSRDRESVTTSFVLPLFLLGIASHGTMVLAQSAGTFTATGNMITPRFAHTATLLPNGKVLIAGGNTSCFLGPSPCVGANSAELYDPTTGAFAATGSMTAVDPKGGVLLPDGRVLFAGSDATGAAALVELYDSSTESFTITGHATTLTSVESATLLNDGKVLLTGTVRNSPASHDVLFAEVGPIDPLSSVQFLFPNVP
jgi:hypothetical protein